jgi:hypothetical protein
MPDPRETVVARWLAAGDAGDFEASDVVALRDQAGS